MPFIRCDSQLLIVPLEHHTVQLIRDDTQPIRSAHPLQHTRTHCSTLQRTLQHAVTHTEVHPATLSNTLVLVSSPPVADTHIKHTAAHCQIFCNTLQHALHLNLQHTRQHSRNTLCSTEIFSVRASKCRDTLAIHTAPTATHAATHAATHVLFL